MTPEKMSSTYFRDLREEIMEVFDKHHIAMTPSNPSQNETIQNTVNSTPGCSLKSEANIE